MTSLRSLVRTQYRPLPKPLGDVCFPWGFVVSGVRGPESPDCQEWTDFDLLGHDLVQAFWCKRWCKRSRVVSSPYVGNRKRRQTLDCLGCVPLPPLREQRRIAEILDGAEALRAKRRAALALLDELTQSIFLDMFGDPMSNPKGWTQKTLGDVLTFQLYGPRFYNESYSEDGIRIVRITDLDSQGVLDFASMPRLTVSDEDREKYSLMPGDILFARTGATVGKVALIQAGDPECIAGAYFIVMRFIDGLDSLFVRSVLTTASVQAIVWMRSQQSAQQNFSGPGLRALPMILPPTNLQKMFAHRVSALESLKKPHRHALSELDQLFASLQHRAFRGEL